MKNAGRAGWEILLPTADTARLKRRGCVHPYEEIRTIFPSFVFQNSAELFICIEYSPDYLDSVLFIPTQYCVVDFALALMLLTNILSYICNIVNV